MHTKHTFTHTNTSHPKYPTHAHTHNTTVRQNKQPVHTQNTPQTHTHPYTTKSYAKATIKTHMCKTNLPPPTPTQYSYKHNTTGTPYTVGHPYPHKAHTHTIIKAHWSTHQVVEPCPSLYTQHHRVLIVPSQDGSYGVEA